MVGLVDDLRTPSPPQYALCAMLDLDFIEYGSDAGIEHCVR
jgi:hypothetical protein